MKVWRLTTSTAGSMMHQPWGWMMIWASRPQLMPGGLHAWVNLSTPVPVRGQVKARTYVMWLWRPLRAKSYWDVVGILMLLDLFHTIHSTCTGKESITPSGAFYRCALLYCACHLCRKVSPLHPSEKRRKNQSFVPIFYSVQQTIIMEVFRLSWF